MQIIKRFFKLAFFIFPASAFSQSTYLPKGSKEYHFIDRLEIKEQTNTNLNFSSLQPFNRRYIVQQAEYIDSIEASFKTVKDSKNFLSFSTVDKENMRSLLANNLEWVRSTTFNPQSSKSLGVFYKSKANFFEVNNKDLFLAINPMLQLDLGKQSGGDETMFLNSRGITVRARIANKIGLSSTLIENQERGPDFFKQQVLSSNALPGVGFYKSFKGTAYDYFDARGYVTFNAAKFIDFQFGYDKNFIGNGYRSLFLSDWGNSYLFFKVNTRIWKLNYQNLFMELMPQRYEPGWNVLLDRKYAAMHHLSMNVTRWLNMGLFESVVFGRENHFDFQYLNPIIFYRHIEGAIGSPDNALGGLDFKVNVKHRFQFYGQFLLDEFILKKVKNDPTNWVNKFGIQLGGKYIDAFGIKNLDLQLEMNRIRPFTYSHFDSVANYTHYNQPLAHPLGANFQELIGIIRYQPSAKWNLYLRGIYYYKGLDSAGRNMGGDIFRGYNTRDSESGYGLGDGLKATCFNTVLNVSYEFRENLFFELSILNRSYKLANADKINTTFFTAGIRMNIWKREYDY